VARCCLHIPAAALQPQVLPSLRQQRQLKQPPLLRRPRVVIIGLAANVAVGLRFRNKERSSIGVTMEGLLQASEDIPLLPKRWRTGDILSQGQVWARA